MSKYYTVKLTGGTSTGPYNIYYDTIGSANICPIYGSSLPATGLTLSTMSNGIIVEVPDATTDIFIYNSLCDTFDDISVTPLPVSVNECICIVITELYSNPTQLTLCYTGDTQNGKKKYSDGTYSAIWNTLGYWDLINYTQGGCYFTSYDIVVPLNWFAVGTNQANFTVVGTQGSCGSGPIVIPATLSTPVYSPNCGQTTGSIYANAQGGSGGWTYSINGGPYTSVGIFSALPVGTYTVSAKDSSGYVLTNSGLIIVPATSVNFTMNMSITNTSTLPAIGNMKYYKVDYLIDTATIPVGDTVTFDLTLFYDLAYTQPGYALFDTTGNSLTLNGSPLTYLPGITYPFLASITYPCNPLYDSYYGGNQYLINNISVVNGDVLIGSFVFGINTQDNGGYDPVTSCYTKADVNVNFIMNNITTTNPCNVVNTQTTLGYYKQQIFIF